MAKAQEFFDEGYRHHMAKEYETARTLYLEAAKSNHADALHNLGVLYENGLGVQKDLAIAFSYFKLAAERRFGYASEGQLCHDLASYYANGWGTPVDEKLAFKWYQTGALRGYGPAAKALAECYALGKGCKINFPMACHYYDKAASAMPQDGEAQGEIGRCHYWGVGTRVNYEKARMYFQRGINLNDALSYSGMGMLLIHGHGVPKDAAKGFEYLQIAATTPHRNGLIDYNLAKAYAQGWGTGVNHAQARHWYEKGVALNHSGSANNLALLLQEGRGGPADLERAFTLLVKACNAPDAHELMFYNLGICYMEGRGTAVDYNKSFECFAKSEKSNDPDTLCYLGWHYRHGKGVQQDAMKAVKYYRKAADLGHAKSQSNLAFCYEEGSGVTQNYATAFQWYLKAAEQGFVSAQKKLAQFYEQGTGTARDPEKAAYWRKKAGEATPPPAQPTKSPIQPPQNHAPAQKPAAPQQPATPVNAEQELNGLIGLDSVKQEVSELVMLLKYQQRRREQNLKTSPVSRHMVFTGNPGTGKTTVARIIARLLYQQGLLEKDSVVEVDRSDLVGEYIGHTAGKTKAKIEEAMGGILFIDEAYTLARKDDPRDFGQEAIDTLLKAMEDHRDRLMVIVAGYTEEMHRFISSNPGLKSRFKKFINFPDYTGEQLARIFFHMAQADEYAIDARAKKLVSGHFDAVAMTRMPRFGNARVVRNFYQDVIAKLAVRSYKSNHLGSEKITEADVSAAMGRSQKAAAQKKPAMERLQELIGLERVKQEVTSLVQLAKYRQMCLKQNLEAPAISMHMVFSGNPGTGKTTVARLIAEIYHELGLLPTSNFVEADRSTLVAGYVGQTALKTQEVIDQAMGGVLFIDEAYSLATAYSDRDFGQEAIDTLLKAMEDHRNSMVVIVAGYTNEMQAFLNSNPGLKSRFTKQISFDDYSPEELESIFLSLSRSHPLTPGARRELQRVFADLYQHRDAHFGNGREARSFYESVLTKLAYRVSTSQQPGGDLTTIVEEDVLAAEKDLLLSRPKQPASRKPNRIGFFSDRDD